MYRHHETIVCLLNPLSNDGLARRCWPQVAETFAKRGIPYELIEHQGDMAERIERYLAERNRPDLVIAGLGGDGTHMGIINGLMRHRRRHPEATTPDYAMLPLGTGNNLAKSFGMSASRSPLRSELRRAVCATAFGARHRIDLGVFAGGWFADAFTVGADARILAGRNRDREAMRRFPVLFRCLRGYPVYVFNCLKGLVRGRPLQARIVVDGQDWYEGDLFNLVINNSRIYAAEFDLTQVAFANDGLLDLLVFSGRGDYLRRYLFSLRALPRKVRKLAYRPWSPVRHVQGRQFQVMLAAPAAAQVDGEELAPGAAFEIGIEPGAVIIRVPVEPA